MTKTHRMKKSPCKKYEMATADYILEQDMQISKKELFEHLKVCQSCQLDAKQWHAICSVFRAQKYDSRPKAKARFKKLMKKLNQYFKTNKYLK